MSDESTVDTTRHDLPVWPTFRQRLTTLPSLGSSVGAGLLWWASLRPSLLPRAAVVQAAISAICLAVGHGVGGGIHRIVQRLRTNAADVEHTERAEHSELADGPDRSAQSWRIGVVLGVVAVVTIGIVRWFRWQRDQRPLVGMDDLSWTSVPVVLVLTVVLAAVLLIIARSIRHVVGVLERAVLARVPDHLAGIAVTAVVVVVSVLVVGLAGRQFARWADTSFGAFDDTTADDVTPPTLPTLSGGPGSLVDWEDLGYEGRNFTGRATTATEIEAFDPAVDALDPIRVYVGLDSADSVDERIDLAIAELERTGAFEREVLVVVTPTGTGWVDPDAARSIEYLHGGDTAIVAVQYSFLPSWIAFLVDTDSPRALGAALFDRMHERWSELPADDRPTLLAFGESLGSMGGETAFAAPTIRESIASITTRYDGALFTGPTRNNALFGTIVDRRDSGSPTWRPVVSGEPHVRVVNRISQIEPDDTTWSTPRVLWVHHPSDAIGTWRIANLWWPPGWSDDPPPYDLPRAAGWLPFVTFVQESFDLMAGFSASPGYGHDYRTDFVHAWSALAPPEGWTAEDADRLQAHLGLDAGPDAGPDATP